MKRKGLKKNKKGFTLVEIIVVLVIIGLLLALAVPAVMKYIGQAADTKVESQVRAGYIAAQTIAVDEVSKNPAIEDSAIKTATDNVTTINSTLGLTFNGSGNTATGDNGAVTNMDCIIENKAVKSCKIKVFGSDKEWEATRTSIEKSE